MNRIAETVLDDGRVPPVGARFPRTGRLLKPSEFKTVFSDNLASSDRFFRVLARPSGQARHRLGMAVSRKIDRRAVGRNRIKRVIRESFRAWCAEQDGRIGSALDIVVLPRPQSATICNEDLFRSLNRHWARIDRSIGKYQQN